MRFERFKIIAWFGFCGLLSVIIYFGSRTSPEPQSKKLHVSYQAKKDEIVSEFLGVEKGTLYSLNPNIKFNRPKYFRGYKIIGSMPLANEDLDAAISAAKVAIDFDPQNINLAPVFYPTIGLRTEKAGKIQDYLFCYHCRAMRVLRNDDEYEELMVQGDNEEWKLLFFKAGISVME